MNFRVVDDRGKTLAHARDLNALQKKLIAQSKTHFETIAQQEMSKTGCTQWEFGILPEKFKIIRDDAEFYGFPALIDEVSSVGLKLVDTQDRAATYHHNGLVRLFSFSLRKQCKSLKKIFNFGSAATLIYKRIPDHPLIPENKTQKYAELYDDLIYLAIKTTFVSDLPDIRTADQFDQRLINNKSNLVATANTIRDIAKKIIDVHQSLRKIGVTRRFLRYQTGCARTDQFAFICTIFYANTFETIDRISEILKGNNTAFGESHIR